MIVTTCRTFVSRDLPILRGVNFFSRYDESSYQRTTAIHSIRREDPLWILRPPPHLPEWAK